MPWRGPAGRWSLPARGARDVRQLVSVSLASSSCPPALESSLVSTPCPRARLPAGQLTKSIPIPSVDCNGVVAGRIRFGLIIKGYSEGYASSEITNAEHLSSGHLIEPKTA